MPVQQGARQDPEDGGRRVPGHRQRAGLPGPLQQRTLQVTIIHKYFFISTLFVLYFFGHHKIRKIE